MKKENFIITIALSLALLPLYAGAQSAASTTPTQAQVEAQVFTACSQAAIEVRDNSIGTARTTYNLAMAKALSERKEAEKKAVALVDADDKKDAIRAAVEEYKRAVTEAQKGLTEARKEAWEGFETNTGNCREESKDARKDFLNEKKATTTENKVELRTMQTELKIENKALVEEAKTETKSLRESLIESFKNFFKK